MQLCRNGVVASGLRQSVQRILQRAGWSSGEGPAVTDRLGEGDVIIVRSMPIDCSLAIEAFEQALVSAVITADSVADVVLAIAAVAAGHRLLAEHARRLASAVPLLSIRRRQILQLLTQGATVEAISSCLGVGTTTVKRELKGLQSLFAVNNRVGLVLAATNLGFPTPLLPSMSDGGPPADVRSSRTRGDPGLARLWV